MTIIAGIAAKHHLIMNMNMLPKLMSKSVTITRCGSSDTGIFVERISAQSDRITTLRVGRLAMDGNISSRVIHDSALSNRIWVSPVMAPLRNSSVI